MYLYYEKYRQPIGSGASEASGAVLVQKIDKVMARQGISIMKHTVNREEAERTKRAELCCSRR